MYVNVEHVFVARRYLLDRRLI